MKQIILLVAIIFSLYNSSNAQWWGIRRQYSYSSAGFRTSISSIDNSVCVTGEFYAATSSAPPHERGGFSAKYDANGSLKWQKIYYGNVIKPMNITDSNGNIFVSGGTNGMMQYDSTLFFKGGAFLIKYNANGSLLFAIQDTMARVNHMAIDQNNNIYLVGNCPGYGSVFGKPFNKGYFMAKFDNNGNNIWVKYFYCPETYQYDFGFCLDALGNIYSTGAFGANENITDSVQLVNTGDYDGFVAKYNSNLDLQWVKTIKGTNAEVCSRIGVNINGDIYVGGYFASNPNYYIHYFDTITVYGILNNASADIFLAKYNASGNCEWVRTAGGNGSDFVKGVYADNSGNAFITGYVGSLGDSATFGNQTFHFPQGNIAMYVAQYDLNGNMKSVTVSQGGQGYAEDITGNNSGGLYVTGGFLGSWNFGSVSLTGNEDMFLLKLDYNILNSSANELPILNCMDIFPNPSSGKFQINFYSAEVGKRQLKITDAKGKTVYSESIFCSGEFKKEIDLGRTAKGIYFIDIICKDERRIKKIILE